MLVSWLVAKLNQPLGLVSSSMKPRRDAHSPCGVRRGSRYPQLCCGTSTFVRSRAGMALPCVSASQAPSACLWERQDGPRALEEGVPRPPNFKASALSAPMSNSGKKPNQKKRGKKFAFSPSHYPFTLILSPNEIIAP